MSYLGCRKMMFKFKPKECKNQCENMESYHVKSHNPKRFFSNMFYNAPPNVIEQVSWKLYPIYKVPKQMILSKKLHLYICSR